MSLVRDVPFAMVAMEEHWFGTCSKIISTGTTGAVGPLSGKTTAAAIISTGGISLSTAGALSGGYTCVSTQAVLIDRLGFPVGQAMYDACIVQSYLVSTLGSTEVDRKTALGVYLQHAASSSGGDLAEYSTGSRVDDRIYFGTTVRTCDMLSWDFTRSTAPLYAVSHPAYYDLRGAKRYLRVVTRVGKNSVTTETSGEEGSRVGALITFLSADAIPVKVDTTSPFSSTTSTA